MALYTLKSRDEALSPLANYTGNNGFVLNQIASITNPNAASTRIYNAIGRTAGTETMNKQQEEKNDNWLVSRLKSIGNAVGTTLAAPVSAIKDVVENNDTTMERNNSRDRMNEIAKKYGYDTYQDVWDARDKAKASGDQATLDLIDKTINPQLQAQANKNAEIMNKRAADYKDYKENNAISKTFINQDPGKFAGSAIKTLSTATDIALPAAGIALNAVQGGVEGIADELERGGLENFDLEQAGKNALVGATTGAVTGALNKGLSSALAKRGGNLFKGGNALTQGINNLGSKTAVGRVGSTLATGAARGALSGAVGGATGGGLSAALNGGDVLGSAAQGAAQGLTQGAATGAAMAGANMALSKTPAMRKLNQATEDWKNSGDNFVERLKNTWGSDNSRPVSIAKNLAERFSTWKAGDENINDMGTNDISFNLDGVSKDLQNYLGNSTSFKQLQNDVESAKYFVDQYNKSADKTKSYLGMLDASNQGVGNAIRELAENGDYILTQIEQEFDNIEAQPTNYNTLETQTPTKALDRWDQLAQQNGYQTYDEVIQRFAAANPGADINAGSVLTWMDNNPGNWNPNMGMAQNPQTEIYDTLNGRNATLEEALTPDMSKATQRQNKLQNLGQRLQKSSETQKYAAMFDALDEKTAARAVETDAPARLSEIGIEPENYGEFAKTSDYINSALSKLAKDSGVTVNAPDLPTLLRADNLDVSMSDNAVKTYNKYINQIIPDGTNPAEYSASNLLETSRWLGQKAEKVRGSDAADVAAALKQAKYITRDLASNAMAEAGLFGDATDDMLAAGLGKLGYDERVQDYYTNAVDGKSPDATELIRRSSLAEQARDMSNDMGKSKYRRSASTAPMGVSRLVLRESGLEEPVKTVLRSTVSPIAGKVTNIAGKALEGVGNLLSGANNTTTPNTTTTTGFNLANNGYNPSTQLFNAIGRGEGLSNAEQARTASYITDATQQANAEAGYIQPLGATTDTTVATPTTSNTATTGSTNVYDALYGTPTTTTTQASTNKYFPTTGDYWTDILADATALAIDADDVTAFASLYSMYQDALSNLQSQQQSSSTSSASTTKLTDKQRQANAAARALDDFLQVENNFGYDVSDIPVLGSIANIGGNEYASKAEALALQVGYMLSGATVNAEEAKKIGAAYVPQPRDSEAVRQSKLAQLKGIISDYQQTYAE